VKLNPELLWKKAEYNKKMALFTTKMDLQLKKLVKCYIWSIALYGAETWDASSSRSETPGKF
jgi:hypothetical protein